MKLILAAALLGLAAPAAAPAPTFNDVLMVCRAGFLDILSGQSTQGALFARIPDDHKMAVVAICKAYDAGRDDHVAWMQRWKMKAKLI